MLREITFLIERDESSGVFVASWDDPQGGGITTQGADLVELQNHIREATRCHFEAQEIPDSIRLHFVSDPVLSAA